MVSALQLNGPLSPPTTPPQIRKNEHKVRTQEECEKKSPCTPKRQHALASPPTSPLPDISKFLNEDEALSGHKRQPSVSKLKSIFGLDSQRCGAIKNGDDGFCRKPKHFYPKEIQYSEGEKDAQIQSVIKSDPSSSPKVVWERLYKLTQLVHCQHQNFDKQRLLRVDSWICSWRTLFDLKESVEGKFLKILQNYYNPTCIATNEDGTPCRSRTMGWRVQNRSKTIDIILKPDTHLDDRRLEYFLRVLRACMLCNDHVNEAQGHGNITTWKEKLQGILKENSNEEGSAALPISKLPSKEPVDYWAHKFDKSSFDIIADNTSKNRNSSFSGIRKALESAIEKNNSKQGYVYAFEDEENPGFVKIGCTTKTPEDRIQEWKDGCNRNFRALHLHSSTSVKVPNAHRVEELCHAELKHRNIRIYCHCCLKPHVEWFKVMPDDATAVIEKWSKWMLNEPHTPYTKQGTLRVKEKVMLRDIGDFMERLSAS